MSMVYPGIPVVVVDGLGNPLLPPVFAGALAWSPSQSNPGAWNTTMKAGDVAVVPCGSNAGTALSLIPALSVGTIHTSFKCAGPYNALTQDDILQGTNLSQIDAALQLRDGLVSETLWYSDEQVTGTTAQRVSLMQTKVSYLQTYVRANGAPAFKVVYAPTLVFLSANLATNPVMATAPNGVLIQAQTYEDQANGADPSYISQTGALVTAIRAVAPNTVLVIQDQVYSKSNPAVIWTPAKVEADVNITGFLWSPSVIALSASNTTDQADTTNCLNAVLLYYGR